MKKYLLIFFFFLAVFALCYVFIGDFRVWLNHQYFYLRNPDVVGGPCSPACEAVYEFPKNKPLNNTDTLPDFEKNTKNRIVLSGTIHDINGKPKPGVILYIYHTNTDGVYPHESIESVSERVHGMLRGWVRTGDDGRYFFYTNKPGPYPSNTLRAHVHCVIKEPDINEYSLTDFVFPDDPLLMDYEKKLSQSDNGGLTIAYRDSLLPYPVYVRNFYLGRGVHNYPVERSR